MTVRYYGFDDAEIRITRKDGETLAIFNVSKTVEYLWVGISNKPYSLLYTFYDHREMLKYAATEQIKGATVEADKDVLDDFAQSEGYDSWDEYVRENTPTAENS